MNLFEYIKARSKEKDTHTVIAATGYTLLRTFIPIQYQGIVDIVAAAIGSAIVVTPNNGNKTQLTNTVTTTETTDLIPPTTGVNLTDLK